MRVVTFNVLDLFEPEEPSHREIIERKLAHLGAQLAEADADVIALQEVGSEALLRRLIAERLEGRGYDHVSLGAPDHRGIGLALISRLPVISARAIARSSIGFPRLAIQDPEPFAGGIPLRRGLLHVRVDADALGHVDVITLHFKSKLGAPMKDERGERILDDSAKGKAEAALRSFVLRSAEALFLRETIDELLAGGSAGVLALGDFNDDADSLSLRIAQGAFYGVDAAQVLTNFSVRAPEARRFSVLHHGRPALIDHVLGTRELAERWESTRILNDALRDPGPFEPNAGPAPDSDHAPVIVSFASPENHAPSSSSR